MRQFIWTADIEDEILTRLMAGESIIDICGRKRLSHLPSESTFYSRLAEDADLSERYARAREAQGHREADEIRLIADTATPEDVNVARLRIDARKWRAAKLAPKVYGDRLDMDVTHRMADLTDDELAAEIARLMQKKEIPDAQ
jgi:hypothetical protein